MSRRSVWCPRNSVNDDHIDKTIRMQMATRTFGPPAEISRVGEHTVLIWDKDITPCLNPPAGRE